MNAEHEPEKNRSDKGGMSTLSWETELRLLTNPLVLKQLGKAFLLAGFLMAFLLSFLMVVTGDFAAVPVMLLISLATAAGLGALSFLAALLFLNNRIRVRFTLDSRGVLWETVDVRAKTGSRLALVLGVLSGSPPAASSGLLAIVRENEFTPWKSLAFVTYNPRHRLILLRNSWRTVAMVACTPENYAEVAAFIAAQLEPESSGPAAPAADSPAQEKVKARSPLPRLLLRTVLVILAATPVFALPYPFELDLFIPLCLLLFALATVWLVPFLGWAVIACAVFVALEILVIGLQVRESMFAWGGTYRSFELFDAGEWFLFSLVFAGLAYLVWFSWQSIKGRILPGLMQM